jgi:hypothetical protein
LDLAECQLGTGQKSRAIFCSQNPNTFSGLNSGDLQKLRRAIFRNYFRPPSLRNEKSTNSNGSENVPTNLLILLLLADPQQVAANSNLFIE